MRVVALRLEAGEVLQPAALGVLQRLVDDADNDVHWTKVLVDPSSDEVLSFQQQVVAANREAVPAP